MTPISVTEPAPPIPLAAPRADRRKFRTLGTLAFVAAIIWFTHARILSAAAHAFILDDPLPKKADAIVVLGGGMTHRPTEAARLYRLKIAPRVLVAHPAITEAVVMGTVPPEGELATSLLVQLGVPPGAIEPLRPDVGSTRDEAIAVSHWAAAQQCRRLVIPTEIFHTRRAKWIFQRTLRDTGIEVIVPAIDPIRYSPDNWWTREEGRKTFRNEVAKLLYYWLKY